MDEHHSFTEVEALAAAIEQLNSVAAYFNVLFEDWSLFESLAKDGCMHWEAVIRGYSGYTGGKVVQAIYGARFSPDCLQAIFPKGPRYVGEIHSVDCGNNREEM